MTSDSIDPGHATNKLGDWTPAERSLSALRLLRDDSFRARFSYERYGSALKAVFGSNF